MQTGEGRTGPRKRVDRTQEAIGRKGKVPEGLALPSARNKVGTRFRKKEGSKQETRERGGRYRAEKGWTPDYRKQQREVDRIDREGNRAGM